MLHLLILVVTCRVGASQGETSSNIDTISEAKIGNEYRNNENAETLNILNLIKRNVEHESRNINKTNAQNGNSSEV